MVNTKAQYRCLVRQQHMIFQYINGSERMDIFPAHIRFRYGESKQKIQTVSEHCRNTAKYAALFLNSCGLSKSAYLVGLVHDAGKYTERFRDYLIRSVNGEETLRGSVNHSGVKYDALIEKI